jgi:branched-subunit amino acid transport protein AzlD
MCHVLKGLKPHTNYFVSVLSKNLPYEILLAITSYTTKAIDAIKTAQNQQPMHEAHYKCRIGL